MSEFSFILPEIDMPSSLDPLDADYTNNLHASQMVHTSILEVNEDNTLQSSVLKSFSYNPDSHQIQLTVRDDSSFSDGSPITIEDIEVTIKRMMFRRPTFPVLRHIVGIAKWAEGPSPLSTRPPGIQIQGKTLIIQLSRDLKNPLFRFSLPLFGVIKASCLDRNTNKLKENCPVSGFYSLKETGENELTFIRNQIVKFRGRKLANSIKIIYEKNQISKVELMSFKDGSFVILSEESTDGSKNRSIQEELGFSRFENPNSRFSAFLLNPKNSLFSDVHCRQYFALVFRKEIAKYLEPSSLESSIFSRILPGYITSSDLAASISLGKNEILSCEKKFKGQKFRWMPQRSSSFSRSVELALNSISEHLDLNLIVVPETDRKKRFDLFVNNKIDILMASSGFWPFDPIGDVQMLFTRGLHQPLIYLAEDPKLQNLLEGLEFEDDPSPRLKKLNEYIFTQSLLNVYSHSKRVYVVKGPGVNENIPIAITPPAPWQVFRVENN